MKNEELILKALKVLLGKFSLTDKEFELYVQLDDALSTKTALEEKNG